MNYKDTLNLPKTTFSMKANLTALEPNILALWEQLDIYRHTQQTRDKKKKFTLHDGPPYANGKIHIGTALNKILKDFVLKYKMMEGYATPYTPGWDCHGLPVEHQLFKQLKKTKYDVDIVDFRKQARIFALKFVDLQRQDFKRLGVFADWENPYLTLSGEYEYWVLQLLKELTDKGYTYRGRKPVNWCTQCETALAEAEVEYHDTDSHSIYLLFGVKSGNGVLDDTASFLVWTTTPWTLVSNVAVAVHPGLSYSLCEADGKRLIVASDRIEQLKETVGISFSCLKEISGRDLEGILLSHPFIERESRVVTAEFVSREEGSGCVHIAPGHGEEDFSLVKKYNLPILMPVDDKGIFTKEAGPFEGNNIKTANAKIIKILQESGALIYQETAVHSYPHCWRCKNPIIFRATFQWFLNVDAYGLREKLLALLASVEWIPQTGIERMKGMLINRPDWCLSRQRLWGIPIPAVKCTSCGSIVLAPSIIEKTAKVFKEKGSDSWFTDDTVSFIPRGFSCHQCAGEEFTKQYDILDVWFESGASFLAVLKARPELTFPADVYLEGSDQHRGWFQVSLIPSVAAFETPPFKTLLTHGFVVDGEGRKMSKSLGNVIAPQEVINTYGADIVRLWTAWGDYTEDIKISPQIIKQLIDVYRKIRNTLRFTLGTISDFDINSYHAAQKDIMEIDMIMLQSALATFEEVRSHYGHFAFHKALQEIFKFCNIDLSSFYLDILKDRLYTYPPNSRQRRSAQYVLYNILKMLIKMIAPVLSFTAEEAFGAFHNWNGKKETIFAHFFEEEGDGIPSYLDNEELRASGERIRTLRTEVLKEIEKKREASIIGSALEASVSIRCEGDDYTFFKEREELLREILIVSSVSVIQGTFLIQISKAEGNKCQRCWNYTSNVGSNPDFPALCVRCANILNERGGI